MWSRWKAPATVVEVKSPNSSIVEIDGKRQHVHSNKLRRYEVRVDEVICDTLVMSDMTVDSCSIVYDKDKEFGPIRTVGNDKTDQGECLPVKDTGRQIVTSDGYTAQRISCCFRQICTMLLWQNWVLSNFGARNCSHCRFRTTAIESL